MADSLEDCAFEESLRCITIAAADFADLADAFRFQDVIDRRFDSICALTVGSGETARVLIDALASEFRISVPDASVTPHGTPISTPISTPDGIEALALFSGDTAQALRQQLKKRGIFSFDSPWELFAAYDSCFRDHDELCRDVVNLFRSIPDRITHSDQHVLLFATHRF